MIRRDETYTGFLTYKDIDFSFVFTDGVLDLVPINDKNNEIRYKWFMEEKSKGVYTFCNPTINEASLIGSCNEISGPIIFLAKVGTYIGCSWLVNDRPPILHINIKAYILCNHQCDMINRIAFMGPEINHIYPVNQAFSFIYDEKNIEQGVFQIETHSHSSTTSDEHHFSVNGKSITSKFGITRKVDTAITETPLSLHSSLIFDFDPCSDYQFILQLYGVAKEYISFLCYRTNIVFDSVDLSTPFGEGKYETFASLHLCNVYNNKDEKALKDNRCIKQIYIDGGESQILQDIANNSLYLRHLPNSHETGRHMDASRFVLITAAFEWEFGRMKPDGLAKSEERKQAEDIVRSIIDNHIISSSGRQKDIFKFLKKLIGAASLKDKIVSACDELDPVVGMFGHNLYRINNKEMVYGDIGSRLSDQRNHYAHGDIDKDFIDMSLLDLMFLEYIILAMQLRYYGIPDNRIKQAIKDLFHLNLAL